MRIEEDEGKAFLSAGTEEKGPSPPGPKMEEDDDALPADKEERLRYKCVREIITTEKTYVDDLNTLITVYLFPIRLTGILSQDQVAGIFSNVETLEPVHRELLQKLTDEDYTKGGEYIGEAFKTMCQYLKMYTVYCANHEHAIKIIESLKGNAEFQKTLAICQTDSRTKGENLSSYIIKPIQRICKYPLFFREIINHTPKDHPDYALLVETKEKIDDVVKAINEGKRRMEQQQKMVEILKTVEGPFDENGLITPSRVWIADFKVTGCTLSSTKTYDFIIYLFNDLIMITRTAPSGKTQPVKGFILLTNAKITVVADTEKQKNCYEVSSKDNKVGFRFFAETEAQRDSIVKVLKSTQKDLQKMIMSGKIINSKQDLVKTV